MKGPAGALSSTCNISRVALPRWHEVPSIDLRRQFGRRGRQSAISDSENELQAGVDSVFSAAFSEQGV